MSDFNEYINSYDYSWLIDFIKQHGTRKSYLRGDFFNSINTINNEIGFIKNGAFRFTAFSADGTKHIVGFAFENSFVCDYASFSLQQPSGVDIEAMTDSVVYSVDFKTINERTGLKLETALKAKHITELLYAEIYKRYLDLYIRSAEERYRELISRSPKILNLISLKELASYLNIRPETLSRIRNKIAGK